MNDRDGKVELPTSGVLQLPKWVNIQVVYHTFPFNKHKSTPSVFIGYCANQHGYRCLDDSERVYVSRHVRFNEAVFPIA